MAAGEWGSHEHRIIFRPPTNDLGVLLSAAFSPTPVFAVQSGSERVDTEQNFHTDRSTETDGEAEGAQEAVYDTR